MGEDAARNGWDPRRRTYHRGVRSVRDREAVVHEVVEALDDPFDERRVVCLLAWVEAEILHDLDAWDELAKSGLERRNAERRVDDAAWPAEVGGDDDRRAILDEPRKCRDGLDEPEVIFDDASAIGSCRHWNVQVGPDEHPFAG